MFDPISMTIMAALAAAGGGAQMYGQKIAQDAQAKAAKEEKRRQEEYQREAQLIAQNSIQESGTPAAQQQISGGAANRAQAFNRITQASAPTIERPGNSMVKGTPANIASVQQAAANSAWNRILGGSQAQLGGYHDWGIERNIAATRAGQNLSMIANLAKGSVDTSSAEQADAAQAGRVWQLVGGLGQQAGMSGMQLGALG